MLTPMSAAHLNIIKTQNVPSCSNLATPYSAAVHAFTFLNESLDGCTCIAQRWTTVETKSLDQRLKCVKMNSMPRVGFPDENFAAGRRGRDKKAAVGSSEADAEVEGQRDPRDMKVRLCAFVCRRRRPTLFLNATRVSWDAHHLLLR